MMIVFLALPVALIHFWYIDAPWRFFAFYGSINRSFLQISSLPLLTRTLFWPVKNEYRKGLVAFSIGMGIFIKSLLILLDLCLLLILSLIEGIMLLIFVCLPPIAIALLFQ